RFQPAPSPTFSCSTTSTSGNLSRTKGTVRSVEPLSTTTVSQPATLARHCSTSGSALKVTTTTERRASAIRHGRARGPERLPGEYHRTRQRAGDRDDEEEEAGRERPVGA